MADAPVAVEPGQEQPQEPTAPQQPVEEAPAPDMVSRAEMEKVIGERQAAKEARRKIEAELAETRKALEGAPEPELLEGYKKWKAEQEEAERNKAIKAGDVDLITTKAQEPLKKQLEAERKAREDRETQLTSIMRDQSLQQAALKANAHNPDQVVALLRHRVKMVDRDGRFEPDFIDSDGQPLYDGNGNRVADAQSFVQLFLALPENANLIKAGATPGSGAKPGGVASNPTGKPTSIAEWNALPQEKRDELAAEMTAEDWSRMGALGKPSGAKYGF